MTIPGQSAPGRPSSGPLMLLDTASLYFRAYFGVPDQRTDPAQPPNNAVRGLIDMIATLITAHRPTAMAACWDDDWRPAFRVEAIPTYKTHRLAEGSEVAEEAPELLSVQVPVIRDALAAVGIPVLGSPGHEADDVIGTLAATNRGTRPVLVVTGDRDLFQLVDDEADIRVLYTARGGVRDATVVDQAYLQQAYGVATGDAYAEMAVLRGDSSDGLPGVKGIGEKTAVELLATFGDLAGLRAAVDNGDPRIKGARRRNLEAAGAYLDVAPRVVRVVHDAPLPEGDLSLPERMADPRRLSELAISHQLGNPFSRLASALGIPEEL